MRAAILDVLKQPLAFRDVPIPEPGPGEVLIRVEAAGVCHSDASIIDGDWRQMADRIRTPLILGHESAGTIVKLGTGVEQFKVGDRVGVPWLGWTCGTCESCLEGRETLCPKQVITGATVNGGFAEYLTAKASHTARIPDGLSFEAAAPILCAGLTAYKALKVSGARPGQTLAVFGIGGLGHLAIQFAKAIGLRVIAVDLSKEKSAMALECGADEALDASAGRVDKAIHALGGAHVALVTSGSKAAYDDAVRSLKRGGTLVVVGMPSQDLTFSPFMLVAKELKIVASSVGTRQDLAEALQLAASGKVRCRLEKWPLERVNEVFDSLKNSRIQGRAVLTLN